MGVCWSADDEGSPDEHPSNYVSFCVMDDGTPVEALFPFSAEKEGNGEPVDVSV